MSRQIRAKCDYCGNRRVLDPKTLFCRECVREFRLATDEYFDGDPLAPLSSTLGDLEALIRDVTPEEAEKFPKEVREYLARLGKIKISENL